MPVRHLWVLWIALPASAAVWAGPEYRGAGSPDLELIELLGEIDVAGGEWDAVVEAPSGTDQNAGRVEALRVAEDRPAPARESAPAKERADE